MSIEETLARIDAAFGPKPWAVKHALLAVVRGAANPDGPDDTWEHNGHGPNEGEPECPGCWSEGILNAVERELKKYEPFGR